MIIKEEEVLNFKGSGGHREELEREKEDGIVVNTEHMYEILKKYKNWKFKNPLFAVSLPSLVSFMVKRRTDQRVLQMYNQMSFFGATDMKQEAGKQVCVMVWDLIIPIVTVFTSLRTLLELISIALHCQELGGVLIKIKSKDCSI